LEKKTKKKHNDLAADIKSKQDASVKTAISRNKGWKNIETVSNSAF